jgi:DisA bacterial checkpoint controller nucleotide-binding
MIHQLPVNLPPSFVIGAHYDTFLQRALSRFFERATLETEAVPSPSSDGRLAIDATDDPTALSVRWFGTRYILRVSSRRPFTAHEVRFARAIGSVLESRFRAILNPQLMVERAGLFRGSIEDRYVGAFFDGTPYSPRADGGRSERVAEVLEMLRVAALSSYENQPISTGVLLLEGDADPIGAYPAAERGWPHYTGALTSIKSFFRLADGLRTVFQVARDGRLLDIVDMGRWGWASVGIGEADAPGARAYAAHAAATRSGRHVCIVLSPSREIKVFAEGVQLFTFRNADWHLLDLQAKYAGWAAAVGRPALARRLFQTALDLADAREGALFVVLRRPIESLQVLVADADRLDMEMLGEQADPDTPSRRHLLHVLAGRTVTDLDASVLEALATLDGAIVTEPGGQLLAVGAILRHPQGAVPSAEGATEGARSTAAMAASRYGPVLKVSEDGMITFFDNGRIWDI